MGIKFCIHEGHPFVIDEVKTKMVLVNPETLETRENASFFNLFKGQRIYGARYLKSKIVGYRLIKYKGNCGSVDA